VAELVHHGVVQRQHRPAVVPEDGQLDPAAPIQPLDLEVPGVHPLHHPDLVEAHRVVGVRLEPLDLLGDPRSQRRFELVQVEPVRRCDLVGPCLEDHGHVGPAGGGLGAPDRRGQHRSHETSHRSNVADGGGGGALATLYQAVVRVPQSFAAVVRVPVEPA
jgi:hypothetical protein